MGVWGAGLYSGDFAMDLRTTAGAVARLPFDGDRLVEILSESEPAAARRPDDPDHTVFWLVVADQMARCGIRSDRAREQALAILDAGADLALHEKLGMDAPTLKKRRKMLEEVRARITAPLPERSRAVLKKPQPLLMQVGDVLAYPTCGGRCANPYCATHEQDRMGTAGLPWRQDGWSAMVVVDCGRAFEFLAWYRPLTVSQAVAEKPDLAALSGEVLWRLGNTGTCSPVHFERMQLEKIGALPIDPQKLRDAFPDMRPGTRAAASDISLGNTLNVGPYLKASMMPMLKSPAGRRFGRPSQTILGIAQLLAG